MNSLLLLVADTSNGIQQISSYNCDEEVISSLTVSFEEFQKALRTLSDEEVLYCWVTPKQYTLLDMEYGVRL
jgi:hypothetical protein